MIILYLYSHSDAHSEHIETIIEIMLEIIKQHLWLLPCSRSAYIVVYEADTRLSTSAIENFRVLMHIKHIWTKLMCRHAALNLLLQTECIQWMWCSMREREREIKRIRARLNTLLRRKKLFLLWQPMQKGNASVCLCRLFYHRIYIFRIFRWFCWNATKTQTWIRINSRN